MKPPSVRLLRSLRYANTPQTCSRGVRTLTCPYQHRFSSQLLRETVRRPAIRNDGARSFTTVPPHHVSRVPKSADRGPASQEDTQTDFGTMDVLGNTPAPTTAIDACLDDGFHLDNGLKISDGCGCILVSGEAFSWRPWEAGGRAGGSQKGRMINPKGQWNVEEEAWGVLDLMWPKPGTEVILIISQERGMLIRYYRSSDIRARTFHTSYLTRNEEVHKLAGHTSRYTRYQERSGSIQSSCYGKGCGKYRCSAHSNGVERAKVVVISPFKRTSNRSSWALLVVYDD